MTILPSGCTFSACQAAGFLSNQFITQYDVSLDDRRFLMIRPVADNAPNKLVVVDNWFEELKAKSRK